MAKPVAGKKASPFSKPKKKDDGFKFQLPKNLGGRGRIDEKHYLGRCVDIVSETSKSSGNPMWTWTFVITAGPHAGRDFKLWTVLTDEAAWKLAETLTALGIEAEPETHLNIKKSDVIGLGCYLDIQDDEDQQGRETSKLQGILPHPKGAGYRTGAKGSFAVADPEDEESEEEEPTDEPEEENELPSEEDAEETAEEEGSEEDEQQDETDEEEPAEEEEEEDVAPPKKTTKKAPLTVQRGGKAKATIGKKKK